ncbi:MAG: OmpA family protein [Flavobacteriaceae bacterium]|nr:OmpA family protein [Flavobacteriaceae bacterium]
MKQVKLFVVALALVATFSANAQDENNPWSIGLGINSVDIRTPDDFGGFLKDWAGPKDINVLPALSRISVGRYLGSGLALEVAGSLNKVEKGFGYSEGDELIDDTFLAIDGRLKYDLNNLIGSTGWFDPYIQAGVGYSKIGDLGDFKVLGGAGFNTWFNENIGLNFQSAYAHHFEPTATDYFQHSIGLVFKFGGTDTDGDGIFDNNDACPEVKGIAQFNGCPDTDGDGIVDSKDACPEVAGLAQLNGCPDTDGDGIADKNDACPDVKGSKAHRGCPDTDGDGIIDKDDKCPKVPGLKSRQGCPVKDTDGDGIEDSKDKCPKVAGPASNNGCPQVSKEDTATLNELFKSVYFKTGKYTFMPATYEILNSAAAIMVKYPTARFAISGYTDSVGNNNRNLTLSQNRANAVKNYLVTKGVSATNLSATGYGESSPIASNKTRAGRAKNRRVEIRLVK